MVELGPISGVTQAVISMWYNGKSTPHYNTMERVVQRLGLDSKLIFEPRLPRRSDYSLTDWNLFEPMSVGYRKAMERNSVDVALELLQDITVKFYRYLRSYSFPVVLKFDGNCSNEQLSLLFYFYHPLTSTEDHRIQIYGGLGDKVYAHLEEIKDGYTETLVSGVFTEALIRQMLKRLSKQLVLRKKELEKVAKNSAKFEKNAEGYSEI